MTKKIIELMATEKNRHHAYQLLVGSYGIAAAPMAHGSEIMQFAPLVSM